MKNISLVLITALAILSSCRKECQDPNNWLNTTYDQNYVNIFFSIDTAMGFTESELDSVIVTNAANDTMEMYKLAPYPLRNAKLLQIGWRSYTLGDIKIYDPYSNKNYIIDNVTYDKKENKACQSDYYIVKGYQVNGSAMTAKDTLWIFK